MRTIIRIIVTPNVTYQPDMWIELVEAVLSLGALVLLVVELGWLGFRGGLNRSGVLEMLASYSTLLPLVLAELALGAAWVGLYFVVADFAFVTLPLSVPTVIVAFVLVDLIYYWEHRIQHGTPILWALAHTVHHSSPRFDQSVAYRLSYADVAISLWFYLPLVLLGFHPLLVLGMYAVNLAYQTWIHTELIGRLGWFDRWFNSPSNHRVHHGSDAKYHDRNFGGVLMIWDRWFGTYQREEETPTYGIEEPLNSSNPVIILFRDVGVLFSNVKAAPTWAARWRLLVGEGIPPARVAA